MTDEEVRDRLGIKYSAAGPRLSELFDLGLAEPLPKSRKKDRQRWRAVPADRVEEVKVAALNRRKTSLLRSVTRQPVWLQGWLVRRVLAPSHPRQEELIKEPCRLETGKGECNCPTANIWVQRHERQNKAYSRVRREAARWRNEMKQLNEEMERAQKDDPPGVQFLKDKQLAREALHILVHLEARVQEEDQLRRARGMGEITDESWSVMRTHVDELGCALESLQAAIRLMLDDEGEFVDALTLDDWGYPDDGTFATAALGQQNPELEVIDVEVID